ncbi:hypothetical protein HMPREF0531_10438 [Lactiplantibacillus plantarum subsp. plantarum ATCC 14917 = JCM 1149 = CGMCC 1.2437]|jgi:hypothetical protein|nr:hypothetical protein HMPREF0531_10438 [Lactiplantibacillus plantarum subsp. plantarum ATCC 14917 = JCM 1149 = CGMCC 1.2437]
MIFKTVILFLYGSISKANPIINIYEFEYEAVITSNSSFEFYMGRRKYSLYLIMKNKTIKNQTVGSVIL